MTQNYEKIKEVLDWYSDRSNYQDGVPGEATLFGWEADNGDRARKVLPLFGAIVKEPKPEKPVKNPRVEMVFNARMDIFVKGFLITHQIPLFAQAWKGFCDRGEGCLVITAYWENLVYRSQSQYVSLQEMEGVTAYPHLISEMQECISEYDPSKQIVIAYCANDFSEQGKRFQFKLEQNYYEVKILDGEYTPQECAEKMGIQQVMLNS